MKRILLVGVLAAAIAGGLLAVHLRDLTMTNVRGDAYVRTFDHPSATFDKALGIGDGQAFAAIARDPAMSHVGLFRLGRANAAYRFGRPLFGYLAWIALAGQAGAVPGALAALCILSIGCAAMAVSVLALDRGGPWWVGLLVPFLPGAWSSTIGLTCEGLALATAAWAVVLWSRSHRADPVVVALFCASVLTRETMIIVPLGLAWLTYRGARDALERRHAVRLAAVPTLALLGWYAVVRVRIGEWPFSGAPGHPFGAPFLGLLDWVRHGHATDTDLLAFGVGVVLSLAALRAPRHEPLRIVMVGFVALALCIGPDPWHSWRDFSRPLLPLYAFGLVLLVSAATRVTASKDADETAQVISSMR